MFCNSLRQRRDLASVIPFLTSSHNPTFRELSLATHDIALPIRVHDSAISSGQQLFLVLTPVSILGSERHTLMSRIERFAILTTNPKPAVAFLLANNSTQSSSINGFHAYTTLQMMLHELSVPVALLPVASPSQLVLLLKKYVDSSLPGHCTPASSPPMRLLRQITATGPSRPLPEHSSNVLSDICGSIKGVAAMMEIEQGMKVLEDYVGEEDARNIERFWAEDWMCE